MTKHYKPLEENPEDNVVGEPEAIPYDIETEMTFSPPLPEEELKNALTTDEVIKVWCEYIDEKFDK
ncbi:MAG: hypothetical protein LIP08_03075 [Bacteroides sp.]|nr:hypothetical protein [Bacteroides sp.]